MVRQVLNYNFFLIYIAFFFPLQFFKRNSSKNENSVIYPSANGKLGEVSESTKHFLSFN